MTKKKPAPAKPAKFTAHELCFSLECAAEFLENEEWPDPEDREQQMAAYQEAAIRIRRMAARIKID